MTKREKDRIEELERKIDELLARPVVYPTFVQPYVAPQPYVPQLPYFPQYPFYFPYGTVTYTTDSSSLELI